MKRAQPKSCIKSISGILALLLCSCAVIFAFWLYSLPGTRGLFEWMPFYKNLFLLILTTACIPLIIFIACHLYRIKKDLIFFLTIAWCIINLAALSLFIFQIHVFPSSTPILTTVNKLSTKPLAHIAISSDIHFGSNTNNIGVTRTILQSINAGGYDALFILGDITELGFPGNNLTDSARYIVSEIPSIPLSTLMGNHDALIGGTTRYQTIFNPNLYYRIDSGSTHILALNLLWGTESLDSTQKDWLVTTLSSIPREDTTIVLSHCFFWSSGYIDATTHKKWYDQNAMTHELSPILEEAGVDLVISGHNHFMEYLERTNIANDSKTGYVIIGTMGGKLDPERDYISPYSLWYEGKQFGFLDLSIFENRLELIFRDEFGKQLYSKVIQTEN